MNTPNYPPSLSKAFLFRSFLARNGEIAVLLEDTNDFLAACEHDELAILGWEVWIVHHRQTPTAPIYARDYWLGCIPIKASAIPAVYHGETSPRAQDPWPNYVHRCLLETHEQLANLEVQQEVEELYQPFLRINFTLEASAT